MCCCPTVTTSRGKEIHKHKAKKKKEKAFFFFARNLDLNESRKLTSLSSDNSSVAVVVQIYLQMNRLDLAKKEVESCKAWAEDAMLAQLMEAWVGLRVGGGDRYQNAYYIYEEIATSSTSPTVKSMVGEAVCNIQMGQYPEAEGILQEALVKEPTNTDAIVNQIVLSTLLSKPAEEINALVQ